MINIVVLRSLNLFFNSAALQADAKSCALRNVSTNLFLAVATALLNDLAPECFLFVFSPNPEMVHLHWDWEEEWKD